MVKEDSVSRTNASAKEMNEASMVQPGMIGAVEPLAVGGPTPAARMRKAPTVAPAVWKRMYRTVRGKVASRPKKVPNVMSGLIWPPDTGPVVKMNRDNEKPLRSAPMREGTKAPEVKSLAQK